VAECNLSGHTKGIKVRTTGRRIPYCARLRTKKLGDSGFFEVGWMGNCPNLLPDGTCKHYEEREHAARNFKFGSIDCNNVRVSYGLPPVEPVE